MNDFANAPVAKNRSKKANDSLKIDQDVDTDEENSLTIRTRQRKKTISCSEENNNEGCQYPIDIWFLLSNYIKPEDVGRFAAICKSSNQVARSATFWLNMYKRYCKNTPLSDHTIRKYALRAIVIRILHKVYPIFITKQELQTNITGNFSTVQKTQCAQCWYRQNSNYYLYYFKMLKKTSVITPKKSILDLDDICANSEEDYVLLKVLSTNLIPLPPILGLTLTSVIVKLNRDMRQHCVEMCFTCGFSPIDSASSVRLILDPVVKFEILNWWHPRYPFSYNMEQLTIYEE